MVGLGAVGTVEGEGMADQVAGGVVDPAMLGQMLTPRLHDEHLGEALGTSHVAVQAPAAGTGGQPHQAHPLHDLEEGVVVGLVDGPGADDHHRSAVEALGVIGETVVLAELRCLHLIELRYAEAGGEDPEQEGADRQERHRAPRSHGIGHHPAEDRADGEDAGESEGVEAHRPAPDPLRADGLAGGVEGDQGQDPACSRHGQTQPDHEHGVDYAHDDSGQAEHHDGDAGGSGPQAPDDRLAPESAHQRPQAHATEQDPVGVGGAAQLLGPGGKGALDHGRGDGEGRQQAQEATEGGGEAGEADTESDGRGDGGGLRLGHLDVAGDQDHGHDHRQERSGVDAEGGGGSGGGHHQAPQGRAQGAGDIEAGGVERHRRRQHPPGHQVGDESLPGGKVEGHAHPENQPQSQEEGGGHQTLPREQGHGPGRRPHQDLGEQHHPGAVEDVGHRPGGEGEEQQRQGVGGLHQAHPGGRAGQLQHQPRGGHGVEEGTDVGEHRRQPQGAEASDSEGCDGGHDPESVWPSNNPPTGPGWASRSQRRFDGDAISPPGRRRTQTERAVLRLVGDLRQAGRPRQRDRVHAGRP